MTVPTPEPHSLTRIFLVSGIVLVSLAFGILVQKILSTRARKLAKKTAMPWDDIFIESLRGFVVLWFFLAGLAVIFKAVPLRPDILKILREFMGVAAIISAVLFIVRLSKKAIKIYVEKSADVPASILTNFAVIAIYLVGFLVILDYVGFRITTLITALGIGGIGVALALQDTLSNLFSGLNILMSKKIRPGDFVRINVGQEAYGQEGYVTDITWRNTTIRGLDNNLIIVPNSKLGQSVVMNTHLPEKESAFSFPVTVGFENDLRTVERLAIEAAREVLAGGERGVSGFEPTIRYVAFTDYGVQFNVVLRIREFTDQYPVRHDFFLRLHERFRQEGVRFPVAARMVRTEKE